ncbi:MAG: hypothetical protein AB1716_05605 [Planctomycetota bacterium]
MSDNGKSTLSTQELTKQLGLASSRIDELAARVLFLEALPTVERETVRIRSVEARAAEHRAEEERYADEAPARRGSLTNFAKERLTVNAALSIPFSRLWRAYREWAPILGPRYRHEDEAAFAADLADVLKPSGVRTADVVWQSSIGKRTAAGLIGVGIAAECSPELVAQAEEQRRRETAERDYIDHVNRLRAESDAEFQRHLEERAAAQSELAAQARERAAREPAGAPIS